VTTSGDIENLVSNAVAVLVLLSIAGAVACYALAVDRGRNRWLGLLAGLCFQGIALLYYVGISKTDEKQKEDWMRRRQWDEEYRRRRGG